MVNDQFTVWQVTLLLNAGGAISQKSNSANFPQKKNVNEELKETDKHAHARGSEGIYPLWRPKHSGPKMQ